MVFDLLEEALEDMSKRPKPPTENELQSFLLATTRKILQAPDAPTTPTNNGALGQQGQLRQNKGANHKGKNGKGTQKGSNNPVPILGALSRHTVTKPGEAPVHALSCVRCVFSMDGGTCNKQEIEGPLRCKMIHEDDPGAFRIKIGTPTETVVNQFTRFCNSKEPAWTVTENQQWAPRKGKGKKGKGKY